MKVRMWELMKGDQIRGWGLCFRSGAQIQVSGSGLKHDLMIIVTSQIKGVGPGPTLAWPGWKQPDISVKVDTAGVLKKLSLAGIAKRISNS